MLQSHLWQLNMFFSLLLYATVRAMPVLLYDCPAEKGGEKTLQYKVLHLSRRTVTMGINFCLCSA